MVEFKRGDKAFIFRYEPNTRFYLQEVVVRKHKIDEQIYSVKTVGDAITLGSHYLKNKTVDVFHHEIKSPTHIKNVLRIYGKRLIADIFERMFKHGS